MIHMSLCAAMAHGMTTIFGLLSGQNFSTVI